MPSLRGRDVLQFLAPILDNYDLRHRQRSLFVRLDHDESTAVGRDIVTPRPTAHCEDSLKKLSWSTDGKARRVHYRRCHHPDFFV